jgi:hypothetical protein
VGAGVSEGLAAESASASLEKRASRRDMYSDAVGRREPVRGMGGSENLVARRPAVVRLGEEGEERRRMMRMITEARASGPVEGLATRAAIRAAIWMLDLKRVQALAGSEGMWLVGEDQREVKAE